MVDGGEVSGAEQIDRAPAVEVAVAGVQPYGYALARVNVAQPLNDGVDRARLMARTLVDLLRHPLTR